MKLLYTRGQLKYKWVQTVHDKRLQRENGGVSHFYLHYKQSGVSYCTELPVNSCYLVEIEMQMGQFVEIVDMVRHYQPGPGRHGQTLSARPMSSSCFQLLILSSLLDNTQVRFRRVYIC